MKLLLALVALVSLIGCTSHDPANDRYGDGLEVEQVGKGDHLQDRDLTEQMFASMREGGVSPDQPLLWGYFFYGEKAGLEKVLNSLKGQGYSLVRLEKVDGEQTFILHVEKLEQHSVDSLLKRNAILTALATPNGVEYDGMDVGPPEN